MALHPIFQEICEAHGMPPANSYRGWAITFEYGYFYATSPNYDASWEGEEDGWVDNGQRVSARTMDGLREEVDAWFEENQRVTFERNCDDCDFGTNEADVTVCPQCRGCVG